LNRAYLFPPSLQDWLPEGHLARFVAEVAEALDLSAIYANYEAGDGRGLIYGDCRGVAVRMASGPLKESFSHAIPRSVVDPHIPPNTA